MKMDDSTKEEMEMERGKEDDRYIHINIYTYSCQWAKQNAHIPVLINRRGDQGPLNNTKPVDKDPNQNRRIVEQSILDKRRRRRRKYKRREGQKNRRILTPTVNESEPKLVIKIHKRQKQKDIQIYRYIDIVNQVTKSENKRRDGWMKELLLLLLLYRDLVVPPTDYLSLF